MQKGFTILETTIAVFILSVIVAIAVPSFLYSRDKAMRNKRSALVDTIGAVKDLYMIGASQAEQVAFNNDDNEGRFERLKNSGFLVIHDRPVATMAELCIGTGKATMEIGSLSAPPVFED